MPRKLPHQSDRLAQMGLTNSLTHLRQTTKHTCQEQGVGVGGGRGCQVEEVGTWLGWNETQVQTSYT